MILIRAKSSRLLSSLAANSERFVLFSPSHLLTSRYRFSSNVVESSTATPFIVKYLVDSVGLSSSEAAKASKAITHIKSPLRPDSALGYFRKNGFTDSEIKMIILKKSILLCANAESTLKPKFEVLRELGFSETQINKLVKSSPHTLRYMTYCNLRPKMEFLSNFLCSNDDFLKAFSSNLSLLSSDLERKIKPTISFLKECQFSNEKIGYLMTNNQRVFSRSLKSLESVVKKVIELGFQCGSGSFFRAFYCLCSANSNSVDDNMKLLVSLGFSTDQVSSLILKEVSILRLSEKNLRETIDFLVKDVGCDHSYVSKHPTIISLSLNKRLIPRNCVLQLLEKNGLLKKNLSFNSIALISEARFLGRFVFPFKDKMPELHHAYLSASVGKNI